MVEKAGEVVLVTGSNGMVGHNMKQLVMQSILT